MGEECEPTKDFLRHIANKVIAENTAKIPLPVVGDIRKALARAEDKYKFTIFGGNPLKLLDYFDSSEFQELIEMLKSHQLEWVLVEILKRLSEDYKERCPPVARRAAELVEEIRRSPVEKARKEAMDLDFIYRSLKIRGYKVEKNEEGYIVLEEPGVKARIKVGGGVIEYNICREGRAHTLDAVIAKIEKISEI
ncbi:MAG: hypothetical protein LRS46_03610 [Desulfurococcales archaeon]|nr:hypothetical protein [Desulfurococcales archaeon]